jgi:hypothetical protein
MPFGNIILLLFIFMGGRKIGIGNGKIQQLVKNVILDLGHYP